jgi:mutator protein MutT
MSVEAKQSIRVVACIIEREGAFLITQRKKESHLGHLWEFPGGKIEGGESLEDCAVRECEEELGIDVRPGILVDECIHDYPEVRVHLYFMKCDLIAGTPEALDCADWTWATPAEFDTYSFPEADKKIIAEYIKGK